MNLRDYPILYVDDDGANRVVMKHNLGQEFTLLIADSAHTALEILAREYVAVLLTDQRMPGVTGVELAEKVLNQHPDIIRVIITAYSDLEATVEAINRARVNRFIKKPWTREELVAVMRESISAHRNARLVKEMSERLMQLDRMTTVAIMAASIAHDLRQPLAYIDPMVEILAVDVKKLRDMNLQPRVAYEKLQNMADCVDDLKQGIEKLRLMSNSLLKSLRTAEVGTEPLDMRDVVESAISITRGSIISRARLEVHLPGTRVDVTGSEGRLIQLIVNLLVNAVQALTEGAAMTNRVTLKLEASDSRCSLSVQDTGCGIAPENLERMFAPFYTTKGNAGTGLGLAICRQIVDEMKGTIRAESIVGAGSTFHVELPLYDPAASAGLGEPKPAAAGAAPAEPNPAAGGSVPTEPSPAAAGVAPARTS